MLLFVVFSTICLPLSLV